MFHFIYKTTNIITEKYYIGAHSTIKIDDGYLGSGVSLKRAIKKHGKSSFVREIICYCNSIDELYNKEIELISLCLNDRNCYNMKPGGKGGWHNINMYGTHKGQNNVMNRCPDIKQQVIENGKKTRLMNKEFYDEISRTNGRKAKEKCTGTKRPHISVKSRNNAIEMWKKDYEGMRDNLSSFFIITTPDGVKITTNRLEEFCKTHDLCYTALWNTSRTNKPVKKGKSKNYICKKITQQ